MKLALAVWWGGVASTPLFALPGLTAPGITARFTLQSTQEEALTDLDRAVLVELTALRETPRAVFHWRPDALDEATVATAIAANLEALVALEKLLDQRYRGKVHVFLYSDPAQMQRLTDSQAVAFSTGTVSVHQTHDFRGVHEFVHIYALQFEREPDTAGPDLFATEGLATWLAESDEGVPIHAWAAGYAKAGALPGLLDLRRTFPEGAGTGVHPYHVAGSFVGYLVGRFGLAKVKRWYMDSSEAHRAFGQGFARLEREWREFLAAHALDPAHERKVLERFGLGLGNLPAEWAAAKGTPLFDGKSLAGLEAEDAARWTVAKGVLVGTCDGPWTHLASAKGFGPRVGVRAKLRLASGNALKLRVNGDKEAVFAAWSSYVSAGEGFTGNERVKIPPGQWVELTVVADGGRACVYLNGIGVFEQADVWSDARAGSVGLAVERGVVELREWVVFEP